MTPSKPDTTGHVSAALAAALAVPLTKLTDFEGTPVLRVGVEMPSAAGGLRDAMKFEPIEMHHQDEGYAVLHWRVRKVRFDEIKDGDDVLGLARVHVWDVDEMALIDGDVVAAHLDDQRARIRKAKDLATGQGSLDDAAEDSDLALRVAHDEGLHRTLDEACPLCEQEAELDAAGE